MLMMMRFLVLAIVIRALTFLTDVVLGVGLNGLRHSHGDIGWKRGSGLVSLRSVSIVSFYVINEQSYSSLPLHRLYLRQTPDSQIVSSTSFMIMWGKNLWNSEQSNRVADFLVYDSTNLDSLHHFLFSNFSKLSCDCQANSSHNSLLEILEGQTSW